MRVATVLQLLAVLGACRVNAFFRMNCGIIQTGRVDPIISYNQVSGHVHKISGASSININSTADTLLASSCTSCQIQSDKSAYWTPQFYFAHADGTFEEVFNKGMTIYYLGRGEDDGNKMKAFPKGLKLFSGNNNARTFDATTLTVPGGRPIAERVNFACVDYEKPGPETNGLPANLACPHGFRAQVHFQSCWDGKNLCSPDQSHMAYLSQIDNGVCPPTHPVLLPHLFYEINYSMDKIDTSKGGKYMFANGDTTGYSFHGDFMNGWDEELLTQAVDQCIAGGQLQSGVVDECEPLAASNSFDAARRCTERSPVYPCESVHGKITTLPGCTGSFPGIVNCMKKIKPVCEATYSTLGLSASPGTDKFSHLGCYTESTNGRALRDKETKDATGMTVEKCAEFCAGFKYAGVEYGEECFCGNTLGAGSVLTIADKCDMACKGNKFQTCGAGQLLNMYQAKAAGNTPSSSASSATPTSTKPSTSSAAPLSASITSSSISTPTTLVRIPSISAVSASPSPTGALANFRYLACYTEAPRRALSVSSITSNFMTPQMCAEHCASKKLPLFGLEYARECWCGASLRSVSTIAPDLECSFDCPGERTSKCGAGDRLSVYRALDYQDPIIPQRVQIPNAQLSYMYAGCYTDGNPTPNPYRALSGKVMADFDKMTVELCGAFCKDYKVFGIEWSGECYCGNDLAKGSTKKDDVECGLTCPGNYKQLACGESMRLSVFSRP